MEMYRKCEIECDKIIKKDPSYLQAYNLRGSFELIDKEAIKVVLMLHSHKTIRIFYNEIHLYFIFQ